jgi:hypothetical protein
MEDNAQADEIIRIKLLRQAHTKRLRVLELQKATMGIYTPPHIVNEIEDIKRQIADIDSLFTPQLRDSAGISNNIDISYPTYYEKQRVEIFLRGDFTNANAELIGALERFVAAMLDISPKQVEVLNIRKGSLVFVVEMPKNEAIRLEKLYQSNLEFFADLSIQNISPITGVTTEDMAKDNDTAQGSTNTQDDSRIIQVIPQVFILKTNMEIFKLEAILESLRNKGVALSQDIILASIQASIVTLEDMLVILAKK